MTDKLPVNVDVTPLAEALRADPSQAGAQMRAVLQETNLEPLSAELHHQIEGSQANYNVGDATDNQVAIYNPNVQDLSAYSINHTPPDRGDGFLESLSGKMTQLKQLYKSIIDLGQRQHEWDRDFDAGNNLQRAMELSRDVAGTMRMMLGRGGDWGEGRQLKR